MVAQAARWGLRLALLTGIFIAAFYLGRPLYWKLSATLHDIRERNYDPQAVKKGFSDLVHEAQLSVGWGNGDSVTKDVIRDGKAGTDKVRAATTRKLASFNEYKFKDIHIRKFDE